VIQEFLAAVIEVMDLFFVVRFRLRRKEGGLYVGETG
jgi:hypothetical protein